MTVGVGLELPSASSAEALVRGEPGAIFRVLFHTAGRAALVGTGLYLAGFRGKQLAKGAVGGAVAIEAFVLAYTAWKRDR